MRLAVCYACLLAGFHTVAFTFPYIPLVRIEFSIGWPAPCTMLGCLLTVYPRSFPVCTCLQLLTACASCLSLLVISCVHCILSLVTVCVLDWCIFWVSISKVKFKRISVQFPLFKLSGTSNNEKKSYNKWYLPLSFSNHNEASPKLVHSKQTNGTVMHTKFQLILMQNAKVLNEDRQHMERAIVRPNG